MPRCLQCLSFLPLAGFETDSRRAIAATRTTLRRTGDQWWSYTIVVGTISVKSLETPGATKLTNIVGYGAGEIVAVEPDEFKLRIQPHFGWNSTRHRIVSYTVSLENTKLSDPWTDRSGYVAVINIEPLQLRHVVELFMQRPVELVEMQTKVRHISHETKLSGN